MTDSSPHSGTSSAGSETERLARTLRSTLLASSIAVIIAFMAFGIFVGRSDVMAQWVVMSALLAGSGCFIGMQIAHRSGRS